MKHFLMGLVLFVLVVLIALGISEEAEAASNNCPGNSCHGDDSESATSAAVGVGIAASSVIGSGNSTVKTSVEQGQGQNQGQHQSADNEGVRVEGDRYETPEIPVATAIGPSMSPSGQCMGVATGGIQGMNIGISLGKSYESKPCNQRELARMFLVAGERKAAMQVLCSHDGAEVTDLCKGKDEPTPVAHIEAVPAKFMGVNY